jgi:hypothetical protein
MVECLYLPQEQDQDICCWCAVVCWFIARYPCAPEGVHSTGEQQARGQPRLKHLAYHVYHFTTFAAATSRCAALCILVLL